MPHLCYNLSRRNRESQHNLITGLFCFNYSIYTGVYPNSIIQRILEFKLKISWLRKKKTQTSESQLYNKINSMEMAFLWGSGDNELETPYVACANTLYIDQHTLKSQRSNFFWFPSVRIKYVHHHTQLYEDFLKKWFKKLYSYNLTIMTVEGWTEQRWHQWACQSE